MNNHEQCSCSSTKANVSVEGKTVKDRVLRAYQRYGNRTFLPTYNHLDKAFEDACSEFLEDVKRQIQENIILNFEKKRFKIEIDRYSLPSDLHYHSFFKWIRRDLDARGWYFGGVIETEKGYSLEISSR